jgi:hypothetical protein
MAAGSSTVIGEAASTTMARGLSARTERLTASIPSGAAVSTLLITTTWARRTLASPGWYVDSCPGRCGSATTISSRGR